MKVELEDIVIRNELVPGDLGYVIYLHGSLYGREYGYGIQFETYVALGMHEFYKKYDQERDRVWICDHSSRIIGFLLLMHRENNSAQHPSRKSHRCQEASSTTRFHTCRCNSTANS